jgi:1-acyl-sn-glycerol-3-phosphate acyltransferase
METLRRLRSALSLVLTLLWFVPGGLVLFLAVVPFGLLVPSRALRAASWYVKMMSTMILGCLRLGGARFAMRGVLPTAEPCLVVANHQSLVDICLLILMSHPLTVAFIARSRYAAVPVVGTSIRMVGCPVIDPKRDPKGALAVIADAARALRHGLLIFPEGHRTRDGEVLPWRTGGLMAILSARRLPVYLAVTDGLWRSRRLVDFALRVHQLRGETEVLGPFEPPGDPAELPAFLERLRGAMVGHLAEMRRRRDAVAA